MIDINYSGELQHFFFDRDKNVHEVFKSDHDLIG